MRAVGLGPQGLAYAFSQFRHHATLTRGGAGIYLVDLSVHGVQVDAMRIEKNNRVLLKDGAMVKFGASTRLYVYHAPT